MSSLTKRNSRLSQIFSGHEAFRNTEDHVLLTLYEELVKDSTGVIKPTVVVNEDVSKYYAYPKFIYHLKLLKTLN